MSKLSGIEARKVARHTDEILQLIEKADTMTRSDVQRIAQAIVLRILKNEKV